MTKQRFIRTILSAITVGLLLGCATTYRAEGFFGDGYTDIPLGSGRYRVEVRGNAATSLGRVQDIAMVRAAEIAAAEGFTHFYVVETASNTAVSSSYVNRDTGQTSTSQYNTIVFVIEPTNSPDGVSVDEVIQRRGPRVGYRPALH